MLVAGVIAPGALVLRPFFYIPVEKRLRGEEDGVKVVRVGFRFARRGAGAFASGRRGAGGAACAVGGAGLCRRWVGLGCGSGAPGCNGSGRSGVASRCTASALGCSNGGPR